MGWAAGHITKLEAGETVSFRPHGRSMSPRIESGQLCTVEPVKVADLAVGDVVLCRMFGMEYLHLVKALRDGRAQIGNNQGRINGWTRAVFGRLLRVEP